MFIYLLTIVSIVHLVILKNLDNTTVAVKIRLSVIAAKHISIPEVVHPTYLKPLHFHGY